MIKLVSNLRQIGCFLQVLDLHEIFNIKSQNMIKKTKFIFFFGIENYNGENVHLHWLLNHKSYKKEYMKVFK